MKRALYVLLMVCGLQYTATAQQQQQPTASVMGLKIAFVTRQLNLSSDEAQKFWPVYYDYIDELKQAREEEKATDVLIFEERLLNLRKRYKVEYKKILGTDDRANKALTIDRDFNAVVKKELEQRAELRKQRN